MISVTLSNEQARILIAAIGTASHCYADFNEMGDHIKLLARISENITAQLPESNGTIGQNCRVKYTVYPDHRNDGKQYRI